MCVVSQYISRLREKPQWHLFCKKFPDKHDATDLNMYKIGHKREKYTAECPTLKKYKHRNTGLDPIGSFFDI